MEDIYREIIQDQKKSNKRTFIVLIVVLAILLITNISWLVGFLWYESQFTVVGETTTVDGSDNGTASYIQGNGDINNGEDNTH